MTKWGEIKKKKKGSDRWGQERREQEIKKNKRSKLTLKLSTPTNKKQRRTKAGSETKRRRAKNRKCEPRISLKKKRKKPDCPS